MRYGGALAAVIAATLVNAWGGAHFDLADQTMIYLLAVSLVASLLTRGPSLLAAVASVAALDFFFVEPRFTFATHDARHFVTFAVMLVVSLLVSGLTLRIRKEAGIAIERERQSSASYAMTRELAVTSDVEELVEVALRYLRDQFSLASTVLLARPELLERGRGGSEAAAARAVRGLVPVASRRPPSPEALRLAAIAIEARHAVGADSELAPSSEVLVLPMLGARGAFGVFVIELPRTLPPTSLMRALEVFAAQTAPSIERGLLEHDAEEVRVTAEAERMRNTVLAGLSHDLRTPLASIAGSTSLLLDSTTTLGSFDQRELLESICGEAGRLTRLVDGLMDLARLQSGALSVNKQLCPVEEVLGSAIGHLNGALADRVVRTQLGSEGELLVAPVDPVLFEQVFINLLENATKYSHPGSPIEVRAWIDGTEVHIEIADEGSGVPAGDELRIFEKFYRAVDGQRVAGAGLGLAVCDAIVKAHGGRISARRASAGGSVFSIGLPLETSP